VEQNGSAAVFLVTDAQTGIDGDRDEVGKIPKNRFPEKGTAALARGI